jgi:AbiV family abortive infection protein
MEDGLLEPIGELSDDQIGAACEAAHQNAVDLLEEADILRSQDRCARAYFLAHIACEEVGKLPILITAAVSRKMGHEVDWVRIDRVLRSHEGKIKQVLFMDSIVGQKGLKEGKAEYEADLRRLRGYTDLKNAALYSFYFDGQFLVPEENCLPAFYDSFRPLARGRVEAFEGMYLTPIRESGGLSEFLNRPGFQRSSEFMELLTGPKAEAAFEKYRETGDESAIRALMNDFLEIVKEAANEGETN